MFWFKTKKDIEDEMSKWLSHPYEFGEEPKRVKFKRTYKLNLISYGKVKIHLVEYEMPNGTKGRGFVNGNLTWSFTGDNIYKVSDEDLLIAYCGWAWLFPNMQIGNIQTDFKSYLKESKIISQIEKRGFSNVTLGDKYKIGTSELFEFTAHKGSILYVGAIEHEHTISFRKDNPKATLPSIYFLLGEKVIQ